MITKNHATAYASLFKKAEEVLTKYSTEFANQSIGNIDDYFACLKTLATLENEHPEEIDPIFTILPATEQTFDIDANTREIKVPENFAKYGVGVQGDEIAEILYFSIDRFFDAMDLAQKEILIQIAPAYGKDYFKVRDPKKLEEKKDEKDHYENFKK